LLARGVGVGVDVGLGKGGGDEGGDRDDAVVAPRLPLCRVKPDIGPAALQRAPQEGFDLIVDLAAQPAQSELFSKSVRRLIISVVIIGSLVRVKVWRPNLTEDPP
jgi:hypothetical protein